METFVVYFAIECRRSEENNNIIIIFSIYILNIVKSSIKYSIYMFYTPHTHTHARARVCVCKIFGIPF